jgi:hypothetical protein
MGNDYHANLTGSDLHIVKVHAINSTAAHTGTPAAVAGDAVVFDANGLPADSGMGISATAGTTMTFPSTSKTIMASDFSNAAAGALANGTTATTQSAGDNSTKVATTAYVDRGAGALANGTTATTQSAGDNSTKVATTAYVDRGAGSAYILLGSAAPSNAVNVIFTGFAVANYSAFKIVINNVVPIINGTNLCVRVSTGSGFITTGYKHGTWRWTSSASGVGGSTSDVAWVISSASEVLGTGANQRANFEVTIFDVTLTDTHKYACWSASGLWASGNYVYMQGGGEVDTQPVAIDSVGIYCDDGNIASGNFYLYGLKNQ